MPFYNEEDYLDNCIASIAGQTLKDIEIILVDDKCIDSSRQIADRWASDDERVKIISNFENLGPGKSRNAGIEAASGKYIAFVDADDFINPDWARRMLSRAEDTGADMVVGRTAVVMQDGTIVGGGIDKGFEDRAYTEPYDRLRSHTAWGILFQHEFIKNNNLKFLFLRVAEDVEFMYRASFLSRVVATESGAVYFYVRREGSLIWGQRKDKEFFNIRCQLFAAVTALKNFKESDSADKELWIEIIQKHIVSGCGVGNAYVPDDNDWERLYKEYKKIALKINLDKNRMIGDWERKIIKVAKLSDSYGEFANLLNKIKRAHGVPWGYWVRFGIRSAKNSIVWTLNANNYFKIWHRKLRRHLSETAVRFGRPRYVRLDFCSMCNLDCPACYMRLKNHCGRGAGYLTFDNFKKFLDKNRFVRIIEIANQGECFLNPDFVKIIEYADSKGVALTCQSGTNFNSMSDEILEAVVKYKVLELNIALDGACQEVYSKYRRGGDFNKVLENIKKIIEIKEKYNSDIPKLNWRYVVLPHNSYIDEIRRAKAMAKELGMDVLFAVDWNGHIPDNREEIEFETGITFKRNFEELTDKVYQACYQLWNAPQINWDGRIFGCCMNMYYEFGGNAFDDGLMKCLWSLVYRRSKKMLMGGGKVFEKSPCFRCRFYKSKVLKGKFMSVDDAYSRMRACNQ